MCSRKGVLVQDYIIQVLRTRTLKMLQVLRSLYPITLFCIPIYRKLIKLSLSPPLFRYLFIVSSRFDQFVINILFDRNLPLYPKARG